MQKLLQKEKDYWHRQVGSIPDTGDSVEEVRKILSKRPIDLDEINGLLDIFGPPRNAPTYHRFLREKKRLHKQVGTIPNTGDSVKEIREIREKLSQQPISLDEINSL